MLRLASPLEACRMVQVLAGQKFFLQLYERAGA